MGAGKNCAIFISLIVLFVCFFVFMNFTSICESTSKLVPLQTGQKPWENIRLSPHIKPTNYHLWLYPDLKNGTFAGNVTISLDLSSVQKHIAVHVKGLSVTKTKLTAESAPESELSLQNTFEFQPNEFWVIVPSNDLQNGRYKLFFEFSGSLTNKIVGFYRSVYKDIDDEEKYIATSKFEPTFARQAFPCFDEPAFKATYNIELVKPSGNEYIALSNMDQIDEVSNVPHKGVTTVKFATTKPMSSYLACFIICDFEYIKSNATNGGFSVNVFARREQISNIHFAKKIAVNASNFYLSYFNVPYPLPKLDLIAIPDFVSGAMENWGLITFRETRLLCNETNSSTNSLLNVALTVCHEVAHMWFGDLVTMKWWDDLWLNEGFASFIEYKAAANSYPEWEIDSIFLVDELLHVLKSDATLSSHPIIMSVKHPDEITEIFDFISYNKGASVIRMLENTIGPKVFQTGVHNYLEAYKFKNAETDDLWSHLNEISKEIDVRSFMETWTLQMGYPVISVNVNKEKKLLKFSQRRFLTDPESKYDENSSPFRYRWEVPITFITNYDVQSVQKLWLKKEEESITVPYDGKGSDLQWLKANFHHYGYYIVNYEEGMWNELSAVLRKEMNTFDPADRASLLFDAFTLADASLLLYESALNMTRYLSAETHYIPWNVASRELLVLLHRLRETPAYDLCQQYLIKLITEKNAISWNVNDRANYLQKNYQSTILDLACNAGHKESLQHTLDLFKQWISAPSTKLHPELAATILNFGVEQCSTTDWDRLWTLYQNEHDPQEKVKFMRALCKSKHPDIIQRYLELGKNESLIRSQDYLSLIITASQNPIANPLVWDFVRNEWEFLIKRYTLNDRNLGRIIPAVSASFSTEAKLQQMIEFFEKYPEAGAGEKARRQALERVRNNIKWRNKHSTSITKWFRANVSS